MLRMILSPQKMITNSPVALLTLMPIPITVIPTWLALLHPVHDSTQIYTMMLIPKIIPITVPLPGLSLDTMPMLMLHQC